ncbi:FAD-binding oxidoreductase [Octadecabacter sp. G9-8]|uniref:FAD-binding oxidoreductase n=1 Tax=Octadecabacter dasysiphoniae TaxID=2909341 RepID=A0ABS9CY66_9RHOB|nr:FAD-dependent oxidoreductase [Octadecabacter dasysiphoniae]MCF2871997.1 FAD-binding oxidoreductase [Octadecabacter dasysiphoniae]
MAHIVIGGGVVGLSIAYGLLKRGKDVVVLDGADDDFRASRGNFGLIWIQGKGEHAPHYATWSRRSADLWAGFAKDLLVETGVDVAYQDAGGIDYFTDEDVLEKRGRSLSQLAQQLDDDYPFEILDHSKLKALVPEIGPKVVGGIYSPMDGHVNPLSLLRALSIAVRNAGGTIRTGAQVISVGARDRDFSVLLADGAKIDGDALVLAAGLGSVELAEELGFDAPIRPQQGQVLITEKLPHFLKYPSGTIRQVNEGGVQIGASKSEAGTNDSEDIATSASLAQHAIDIFPHLERVKLVRSWAALRIMSPDGYPIYQRSQSARGASFVTCHSGITLAAAHASLMPDWILERNRAPDVSQFSESRFHV